MDIIISPINIERFQQIYTDMLVQFPKNELKDEAHFLQLFNNENYNCSTCSCEEEEIGYLLYYKTNYLWLDYVAMYEKFQSKGFGTKILTKWLEENNNLKGCFFEVEKADEANINSIKRQAFYKNLGCIKLDFEYYFPNDLKELPMDLLYLPLSERQSPTKPEIIHQIAEIFTSLHYNVKTKDEVLTKIKKMNASKF